MSYADILKLVKQKRKIKTDKCLICQLPFEKDDYYTLSCNHKFHHDCTKIKYKSIKCEYCLKISYLKKKCKICKKYIFNDKCIDNHEKYKCKHKLKSGKNKGKQCNKINCKIHKNVEIKECQVILKSGKRKGEKCNRIKCRYHSNLKNHTQQTQMISSS